MLRSLAFFAIRCSGVPWALRHILQRRRVTIFAYHEISPERARRHLQALKRRYNLISLREYVAAREAGSLSALPRYAAVLTLDDGHRSNAGLGPVLRDLGVPATIFVCSGIVGTRRRFWFRQPLAPGVKSRLKQERESDRLRELEALGFTPEGEFEELQALTADEIRALAPQVDFQAHSIFHPVLPNCSDEEARHEIELCREQLQKEHGWDVYAFAYPNGDFGEREMDYVARAGYRCGLTITAGYADAQTPLYCIPRMVLNDHGGVSEALVQASGLWGWLRPVAMRAIARTPWERTIRDLLPRR